MRNNHDMGEKPAGPVTRDAMIGVAHAQRPR